MTIKYSKQLDRYNKAAFELHQAAERFYHTILLVFTGYKPKLHDLEDLGGRAGRFCGSLKSIFPKNSDEEKRLFNLLKQAYTEARYNMAYKITKEELEYLATCVLKLQDVTKKICQEKIESMR